MTARRPMVNVDGKLYELPVGDTLLGATATNNNSVTKCSMTGALAPITGNARWYPDRNVTLVQFYFCVGTQSGSQISLTIKVNGIPLINNVDSSTIFTLPAHTNKSPIFNLSQNLTTSDYVTVDITAASGGADMVAFLLYN
jgi:hypothetical protein